MTDTPRRARSAHLGRCGLVLAVVIAVSPARAWAQQGDHQGGLTPFRGNRAELVTGATFALNNDMAAPFIIEPAPVRREDSGYVFSYNVRNQADVAITDVMVEAWLVTADGTIKGVQAAPPGREVKAGKQKKFEFTIKSTDARWTDFLVLVPQAATLRGSTWRRPAAGTEDAVKRVVAESLGPRTK